MEHNKPILDDHARKAALHHIKVYFDEERDEDLGDLAAGLILDFFLEKVGPAVYNQGLRDARAWFERRMQDLEVDYGSLEMNVGR
jgi:uncharacterized protein (DUF2164 family)